MWNGALTIWTKLCWNISDIFIKIYIEFSLSDRDFGQYPTFLLLILFELVAELWIKKAAWGLRTTLWKVMRSH